MFHFLLIFFVDFSAHFTYFLAHFSFFLVISKGKNNFPKVLRKWSSIEEKQELKNSEILAESGLSF